MASLIIYLGLCVTSILAGRGLLRLTGLPVERRAALYLAPALTLVLWTLCLGVGVLGGGTVRQLWPIPWLLTVLMALSGVWPEDLHLIKNEWAGLLIVMFLPIGLMAPYFWSGLASYPGSPAPDGWSYIAYGQYLWEYPRGTEGGLAPLYQYAAHLNQARFIASALLGFLSPIVASAGDTQAASGYFLAWTIFVFASSCMFFAVVTGLTGMLRSGYVSLAVFSGWLVNLLWANNYDNALAISFLPILAGVSGLIDPRQWRWNLGLAGLVAGVLYCYPEMAPFILGGAGLFLLPRFLTAGPLRQRWLWLLASTAGLTMVIVAPFTLALIKFIWSQFGTAMNNPTGRPGENFFGELLSVRYGLVAWWGLGQEHFAADALIGLGWGSSRFLLAVAFSILAGIGLVELFRRKAWGLGSTIILLCSGALVMIFYSVYDYGAYKFLLLSWWGLAFAVITGLDWFVTRSPMRAYRRGVQVGLVGLCCLFVYTNGLKVLAFERTISPGSIQSFKQVEQIKAIVGNQPVIVAIDDAVANEWAVYFLRDRPVYLAAYRAYMAQPHVVAYMDRAKADNPAYARYVLADSRGLLFQLPQNQVVWSGGPYTLWALPKTGWLLLNQPENLSSMEEKDGKLLFWLGRAPVIIPVVAATSGTMVIKADFIPGPSLPNKPDRDILITTNHGYNREVNFGPGEHYLEIPLETGLTKISLQVLNTISSAMLTQSETQPLLLGIAGPQITTFKTTP